MNKPSRTDGNTRFMISSDVRTITFTVNISHHFDLYHFWRQIYQPYNKLWSQLRVDRTRYCTWSPLASQRILKKLVLKSLLPTAIEIPKKSFIERSDRCLCSEERKFDSQKNIVHRNGTTLEDHKSCPATFIQTPDMPPSSSTKKSLFQNEDCDRPACDDIASNLPKSVEEVEALKKKMQSKAVVQCPPKSAELGRSSWTLLHTMAAWYPDQPTTQQKSRMANFFQALAEFYPCPWCADDFQQNIDKTPIQADSREDLCMWLCDQHNRVNKKLGKPVFDCNMTNLDERWRKSTNPKCQPGNH